MSTDVSSPPPPLDAPTCWAEDIGRMGLDFGPDGACVTVTHRAMPLLFGRPAFHEFSLTLTSTSLVRLRRLLSAGDDVLHLPVRGHVVNCEGVTQPTTRLIATAQTAPDRRLMLEVTTWNTSLDGTEAWLDAYHLDDLTAPDLDHYQAVAAMWDAGIRPRHDAIRYVAAGFSPREARHLQDHVAPADRDAQIDLLTALRAG